MERRTRKTGVQIPNEAAVGGARGDKPAMLLDALCYKKPFCNFEL